MFIINLLAILCLVDTGSASISDGLRTTRQTAFISPTPKTRRSRLYINKPDPPSIKPPPLEDDILAGDDIEIPPLFDISELSSSVDQEVVKEFGVNLSKTYVAPIFSRDVVRGVPADIFKGALVSGIGLSVLAGKGVLFTGAPIGLGLSYIATTPGPIGDSARIVGKFTWSSTQVLLQLNKKFEVGKKVGMALKSVLPAARAIGKSERLKALTERLLNDRLKEQEEELPPQTVKVDDEITRLVKEAEDTVASVQDILDEENTEEAKMLENELEASLNGNISIVTESDIEDDMDATSELVENVATELQKAQIDEQNQRSLLETRLEIETTEKNRKVQIEAERKQRSQLETRLEIETTEESQASRNAQIEAEREQRSLLETRLEMETTEKNRKAQIEAERKQRSLLGSRLKIETTEKKSKSTDRGRSKAKVAVRNSPSNRGY